MPPKLWPERIDRKGGNLRGLYIGTRCERHSVPVIAAFAADSGGQEQRNIRPPSQFTKACQSKFLKSSPDKRACVDQAQPTSNAKQFGGRDVRNPLPALPSTRDAAE